MFNCLIDQTWHESLDDLHKHLRKLKVKKETYYVTYYDRRDRLTGQTIPFTTVDKYLATEFLCKDNLKKWIAANPVEGRQWAVDWLMKRKSEKDLIYPPTQVELESLMCPSIHYYNRVGGYNAICTQLGYQIRFTGQLTYESLPLGSMVIDTREQNPLGLVGAIHSKLNVGDYGLIPDRDLGVYVERKSLVDLVGTLSLGHDRFLREMERAKEVGAYVIILVESPISVALEFKPKHGTVTAAHVFKRLRDLLSHYDNVQALFVKDRVEASHAVTRILSAGISIKSVDLQYAYECKQLIDPLPCQ